MFYHHLHFLIHKTKGSKYDSHFEDPQKYLHNKTDGYLYSYPILLAIYVRHPTICIKHSFLLQPRHKQDWVSKGQRKALFVLVTFRQSFFVCDLLPVFTCIIGHIQTRSFTTTFKHPWLPTKLPHSCYDLIWIVRINDHISNAC